MKEILMSLSAIVAVISAIVFFIGLIMLFFKKSHKLGLKLISYSAITFLIGFSTCASTFTLNLH